MQRLNRVVLKQSSRALRRFLSTEAKTTTEASTTTASTTAKEAAAKVTKDIPKAPKAPKPTEAPKPAGSPKPPKKSGKAKAWIYGSIVVVLGGCGLYRYHTNNDHLACISKVKGGDNSNILETLYLMPKHLEDKYENFMFTAYCDRLIYEIMHNNPLGFKTMEDVVDYFSKWFSTLGLEIDNNAPLTEDALIDLFSEFSKEANAYNLFIIGERYFHISPMTEFMSQTASRYFDSQRVRAGKEFIIPMEKVVSIVETLQEKTKEVYYDGAFKPNFADKMFSGEARSVKPGKLIDVLKKDGRKGMGVYEFVNVMAIVERQTKNKKFYFYVDDYVDRMVGESLFDHDMGEEEVVVEEEEEEEEVKEEEVKEEEVKEEVKEEEVKEEEVKEEEVKEEEVKEVSLDDLLDELERVNSSWWDKILHADFEGLKNVHDEEVQVRKELKKMDWW